MCLHEDPLGGGSRLLEVQVDLVSANHLGAPGPKTEVLLFWASFEAARLKKPSQRLLDSEIDYVCGRPGLNESQKSEKAKGRRWPEPTGALHFLSLTQDCLTLKIRQEWIKSVKAHV